MFDKKRLKIEGREAIVLSGLGTYSLRDTLECGQCFRHVLIEERDDGYVEYLTVVGNVLLTVAQRKVGELILFGISDAEAEEVAIPYLAAAEDYAAITESVLAHSRSEFLSEAAAAASGIRILRQQPWEALFSFIVSQNNNIPRIKKIIRALAAAYGRNLAIERGLHTCPCGKCATPCEDICRECGICYTFPEASAVADAPELMLPSHPGFRYKYLLDAAERVSCGEIDLEKIASAASYGYTTESLMRIKGVGLKVAACTALFGFGNLEAFPIDVWMKRAIDTYFGGTLDPAELGPYAGVAQQYIFHYIRILNDKA